MLGKRFQEHKGHLVNKKEILMKHFKNLMTSIREDFPSIEKDESGSDGFDIDGMWTCIECFR